ncbi:hypothetical protein [Bauldia litoralis]|uniref:Uncharacterized protein n=1 Tax=Bauldia litoralis TaxID=665467 RepID=A0A1G6CRH9_9HYPH|nr:hypothetical protein [Bauldia litoralis]SDB35454.1 hypothetical protein SAMN02982931_02650 [Bauldia litoralis]
MNTQAIKLFGTDEPAPTQRLLTAGPITATLEDGQLRWIRIGDAEAVRAIGFLVRDRNWSTPTPEVSDLTVKETRGGFKVAFDALWRTADGTFSARLSYTAKASGTLTCEAVGAPAQDFQTCRTGFVILHPLKGFVGKPVTIEHADGSVATSTVPEEIVPDQPFLLVRAMTHSPLRGVKAELRMEGDTWETEDHRNWTDASFKTYSRPLSLPYPYPIAKGEEVRQSVTLTFTGKLPKAPAEGSGPVTVKLGEASGKMPRIGVSVLPEDARAAVRVAPLVKAAGVQHINCRIDLRDRGWDKPLGDYAKLAKETGAEVVLEIIIPGDDTPAREIGAAGKAVRAAKLKPAAVVVTPAADLKSYPPGTPHPDGIPTWEAVASATRRTFRTARIGGGMLSNFTELNRKRPPNKLFDFITHRTSATVHAADDRSVMETLEAVGQIIHSTRAIIGKTPYRIGPSHIGNSFNPYGAAVSENPNGGRVTMARVDPRHRGLFGAAWHLGYLGQVADGGLEAATMASPVGEFGIAYAKQKHAQPWFDTTRGAKVYPVYHVIRGIAGAAGARHVGAVSADTDRVRVLAWKKGKTTHVWLASLRDETVDVKLRGLPKGKATLMMLDAESFEAAARDPSFGDVGEPFKGSSVTLGPFAVARLDITG